jgi:CheY-like chemotaxis protein
MALMDSEAPDLVITELHRPGMGGLALARHVQERRPAIPVILLTARVPA